MGFFTGDGGRGTERKRERERETKGRKRIEERSNRRKESRAFFFLHRSIFSRGRKNLIYIYVQFRDGKVPFRVSFDRSIPESRINRSLKNQVDHRCASSTRVRPRGRSKISFDSVRSFFFFSFSFFFYVNATSSRDKFRPTIFGRSFARYLPSFRN